MNNILLLLTKDKHITQNAGPLASVTGQGCVHHKYFPLICK